MEYLKLDKTDTKIIEILKKNCRTPYSNIAKELKTSPEKVKFRVQRLLDKKIINAFKVDLNLDSIGFIEYNMYIKLSHPTEENKEKFQQALIEHPYTRWVATCAGEWDFRIILVGKNSIQLKNSIEELENICYFKDTLLLTRLYKEEKHLVDEILKNKYERTFRHVSHIKKGQTKMKDFDDMDWALFKEIIKNPRVQFKELSIKTGISAENARYRINKILNSEAVHGLTISLNRIPSNTSWEIGFLKINAPIKPQIRKFLLSKPQVHNIHHVLGEWDIELTLNFKNIKEKQQFFDELDNEFPNKIMQVDIIEMYDNLKFPQIAMGVFDEYINKIKNK